MSETNPVTKQLLAGLYGRAAPTYEQIGVPFFAALGRRLVELSQLGTGSMVLDVGVGRGAVLLPAAQQVGPAGQVIGIDIAEGMLQATATDIQLRHLTSAHVAQMDAEELALAVERFDRVLCAFAVFFLPHLDKALSE